MSPMNPVNAAASAQSPGFGHVLAQTDAVGATLLAVLLVMSALSWLLIVVKGVGLVARRRRSGRFLDFFWNAATLDEVSAEMRTHGVRDPFAHLTSHAVHAQAHHAKYGAARLA